MRTDREGAGQGRAGQGKVSHRQIDRAARSVARRGKERAVDEGIQPRVRLGDG